MRSVCVSLGTNHTVDLPDPITKGVVLLVHAGETSPTKTLVRKSYFLV